MRLFASLREHAGAGTLQLELADGATVADAIAALRGGALAGLPENAPFVTAVAREYVKPDHALAAGDELALVPPVSGGAPGPCGSPTSSTRRSTSRRCGAASPTPRPARRSSSWARRARCRASSTRPTSTWRASRSREIAARVVVEHGCVAVACVHRVGIVPLGDPSVVVAASAAHRGEAFDGARALLDAVKAQAPIWKKEHYEDGDAAWVEGTLPQA